jgi:hypothetical protein
LVALAGGAIGKFQKHRKATHSIMAENLKYRSFHEREKRHRDLHGKTVRR